MKKHKMLKVPADLHASIKLEAAKRQMTIMEYVALIHRRGSDVSATSTMMVGGVPTRVKQ